MSRLEAEAIVWQRRQQEGRSYENDHSIDESVERLLGYPLERRNCDEQTPHGNK